MSTRPWRSGATRTGWTEPALLSRTKGALGDGLAGTRSGLLRAGLQQLNLYRVVRASVERLKANLRSARGPFADGLLALLLGLQALDWHSTLAGRAVGRLETNKLVQMLAAKLSFAGALAVVKAFDVAAILVVFLTWRSAERLDQRPLVAFLIGLVALYTAVVINNYSAL